MGEAKRKKQRAVKQAEEEAARIARGEPTTPPVETPEPVKQEAPRQPPSRAGMLLGLMASMAGGMAMPEPVRTRTRGHR